MKKITLKKNPNRRRAKNIEHVFIDVSTADGEALNLIKVARDLSKQLQLNWNPIYEEMNSDDYDHLVEVFEKHFGEFVTLY